MSVVFINPCLECGACCATFRVSFYWAEAAPEAGGRVPPELTVKLNDHRVAMQGTTGPNPRCAALVGEIGCHTHCSIYTDRSSTCREFKMALEDDDPDSACDRARVRWGLPPLKPSHPQHPTDEMPLSGPDEDDEPPLRRAG
ncbi:MAG: YkgJ family cysteine cluster protein [Pseudomonadota bacterium]